MLTAGSQRIEWSGGAHVFCLTACGMVMALEDRRRAAIGTIFLRLAESRWYASDIRETVRLALIGGGQPDREADELVQRFVDRHAQGFMGTVPLAMTILEPVIVGVPDDKPDEPSSQPAERAEKFQHDDGRLKRSAILGLGAALGWTASQTYAASVWEIAACIRGYNKANGASGGPEPPTNDEFDAMLERHKIRVH
jgi:hypothetical protein